MVYSIFTPHLLYWLKHVDASWNYSASRLNLLVQTWLLISVSTVALGAGGSSLNPIQASENIVMLETNVCTSSVPTWHRKNRCMIFTSGMMTHEESYVLRCLKNGTLC